MGSRAPTEPTPTKPLSWISIMCTTIFEYLTCVVKEKCIAISRIIQKCLLYLNTEQSAVRSILAALVLMDNLSIFLDFSQKVCERIRPILFWRKKPCFSIHSDNTQCDGWVTFDFEGVGNFAFDWIKILFLLVSASSKIFRWLSFFYETKGRIVAHDWIPKRWGISSKEW